MLVKMEKMGGEETQWRAREWVGEKVFEGKEEDEEGSDKGGFAVMVGRPFGAEKKECEFEGGDNEAGITSFYFFQGLVAVDMDRTTSMSTFCPLVFFANKLSAIQQNI